MNDVKIDASGLLPTLLTVLFVGLKLTGYISWSWWWVVSPLWIISIVGFLVGFIVAAMKELK